MSSERKYLPTFAELIDRLSILQLKEIFIPEHKKRYAEEINDILYDLKNILKENGYKEEFADIILDIIVLSQFNLHIWHNEAVARSSGGEGNLRLTHSINGIRNHAKNRIQSIIGGRKDYKIDCLAAEFSTWYPSKYEDEKC